MTTPGSLSPFASLDNTIADRADAHDAARELYPRVSGEGADVLEALGYVPYDGHNRVDGKPRPARREAVWETP